MTNVVAPTLNLPLFNEQGDQIDYTLYDRMQLDSAAGAIQRDFFSVGLGETDSIPAVPRRKTLADTNVRKGQIPEGQAFANFGICLKYESNAIKSEAEMQAFRTWLSGVTLEYLIESKNQYGIWKANEVIGLVDDSIVTAGATGQAFEGSQGEFEGKKKFNLYIPLPRLTTYNIRMNQDVAPDASMDADFLKVELPGVLNRAG